MPFVYIVRCADNSLYVGWTEDIDLRLTMHNEGRGGNYTAHRRPVTIVFVESHETHDSARARERQLKRWTSAKKEALIAGDVSTLERLAISHTSPRFNGIGGRFRLTSFVCRCRSHHWRSGVRQADQGC